MLSPNVTLEQFEESKSQFTETKFYVKLRDTEDLLFLSVYTKYEYELKEFERSVMNGTMLRNNNIDYIERIPEW